MDPRPENPLLPELGVTTETGQIPALPTAADAGERTTTWRTTAGVVLALTAVFVVIVLMGL